MVLHHLGESTLSDVKELEQECAAAGAKSVIVAGDIANEQTAKDVSHCNSRLRGSSIMHVD